MFAPYSQLADSPANPALNPITRALSLSPDNSPGPLAVACGIKETVKDLLP
jgi:hypothetical protein